MKHLVTLNPGNHKIYVDENESILQAALSCGLQLPYSCQNGACHLCQATLIKGQAYNQNSGQQFSEGSQSLCFTCITRPRSNITITLPKLMAPGEFAVQTLACQIKSTEYLTPKVLKVTLLTPANKTLQFHPGQYLDIHLADGKLCSFSIANAPIKKRHLELHIGLDSTSDDLQMILEQLKTQVTLSVDIPKGDCYLTASPNTPLLLIAASTGLSQTKSILEFLLDKGLSHPVYFYWGCRTMGGFYFHEQLIQWEKEHPLFKYQAVVSAEKIMNSGLDVTEGLVYQAILKDFTDLSSFQIFISGSPTMVYATVDALKPIGLKSELTYSDVFSYAPRDLPTIPDQ